MSMPEASGLPGKRLADDAIYLREDRKESPKEYFKLIADRMEDRRGTGKHSLLDVGCATGELVAYLQGRFPGFSCSGVDVSSLLIERARRHVAGADFQVGSILDGDCLAAFAADIVVCAGTVQIFDDLTVPVENLSRATKPGGLLLIFTPFNEAPIDLITRYREPQSGAKELQMGWNLHSKHSFEAALRALPRRKAFRWTDFRMPFAIPPGPDPMRTWTIATDSNQYQLINGAGLMVNLALLEIEFED